MKTIALIIILIINSSICTAQINQMIVGANNNGAIMSALLDGTLPTELTTGVVDQSFYNGVYHSGNGKVYMSWYYGIYEMDVDGSNFITIYYFPAGGMGSGIDVDETNGHIYFTNSATDSIYRMDLNGSNLMAIYGGSTNVNYLGGLRLDVPNGHIYFGDRFGVANGLFRLNMNGTNKSTLINGIDVIYIELDLTNSKVYYTSDASIQQCNLNGTGDVAVVTGFQPGGVDIDLSSNTLYTTDMTNHKIISADMSSWVVQDLVISTDIYFSGDPLASPHGPVLVHNPAVIGLSEFTSQSKDLVKIIDLMGRETTPQKNRVLIYVYSDGTTEKVFEFE